MTKKANQSSSQLFIRTIENQVLAWWENYGLERLAVTAPTQLDFQQQTPPALIRTSVKKREGRKTVTRGKRSAYSYRAQWLDDGQAIYRYPAFVYVAEGIADFHVADYMIECPANHFLLFRDNLPRPMGTKPHFEGGDKKARRCSIVWFFMPPGESCVVSYICHSHGDEHWSERYHVVALQEAIYAFKIFLREAQEQATDWRQVAHSSFRAFLYVFLRELKNQNSLETIPHHIKGHNSVDIEQAQEYIRSHLHQPLTSSQVADTVHMSRNSFMQHFTRVTGQTFHEFLTEERMKKARIMLGEGRWSINFVCRRVGLKPTRFRNLFRERFGVTPSEFRSQHQNKGQ